MLKNAFWLMDKSTWKNIPYFDEIFRLFNYNSEEVWTHATDSKI